MIHELPQGRIHEGDWLQADLEPGYTLAIVDGPYGMGKAAWDRVKVDQLADWYAPHVERLTGLMAASATVYLWNTAEGWARLDPVMRAAGWGFRSLIVWDKGGASLGGIAGGACDWPESTEVCGVYGCGEWGHQHIHGDTNVWHLHWNTYSDEKLRDGTFAFRTSKISGQSRVENALHPCQKPLIFAERMIRASSRPGERVLVPFGGTCREAVICEWLARTDPKEARRYDVCELNQDGPDYIGAALAQIRGEDTRKANPAQVKLFGAAK